MRDLAAFAAIMAVPGIVIVLVLRHAWRSRGGTLDGDSGSGDWSYGGGGDGGD